MSKEQVSHPHHYNKGIERWDYTISHDMGFLDGNVIKYVTRFRHKNGLQDLHKAKEYLDKLIEVESSKEMVQEETYKSKCIIIRCTENSSDSFVKGYLYIFEKGKAIKTMEGKVVCTTGSRSLEALGRTMVSKFEEVTL